MINAATPLPIDRVPSAAPAVTGRPPRRVVRCEVLVIEPEDSFASDLLPWADPYIASLVASLQREESEARS